MKRVHAYVLVLYNFFIMHWNSVRSYSGVNFKFNSIAHVNVDAKFLNMITPGHSLLQ